jgi:hypothetical protein
MTKVKTDTLTLIIAGVCTGSINGLGVTKTSDWSLGSGDTSLSYNMDSLFSCSGVTPNPTYVVPSLGGRFSIDNINHVISWSISSFTADEVITFSVVGTLQNPHSQTVT